MSAFFRIALAYASVVASNPPPESSASPSVMSRSNGGARSRVHRQSHEPRDAVDLRGIAYECDVAEAVEDTPSILQVLLRGTLTCQSEIEPVGSADDPIDRLVSLFAPKFDQGLVKVGEVDPRLRSSNWSPSRSLRASGGLRLTLDPSQTQPRLECSPIPRVAHQTPVDRSNEFVHRALPRRRGHT
jgi:hypothetical protein